MLDHLALQVADLEASCAFYDAVLAPLGGRRLSEFPDVAGYGTDRPDFWVGTATDTAPGIESHVAFTAPDRAVDAFRDAAVSHGAEVLHEPRVFPEYHADYYGAFVRDPDGNNVEACCHQPG